MIVRNSVLVMVLSCVSILFPAERNREVLQQIFGKELYAVARLRANAQTIEAKIEVQAKMGEQFVALVEWAKKNGCEQDKADELERELVRCQEEKKEEC